MNAPPFSPIPIPPGASAASSSSSSSPRAASPSVAWMPQRQRDRSRRRSAPPRRAMRSSAGDGTRAPGGTAATRSPTGTASARPAAWKRRGAAAPSPRAPSPPAPGRTRTARTTKEHRQLHGGWDGGRTSRRFFLQRRGRADPRRSTRASTNGGVAIRPSFRSRCSETSGRIVPAPGRSSAAYAYATLARFCDSNASSPQRRRFKRRLKRLAGDVVELRERPGQVAEILGLVERRLRRATMADSTRAATDEPSSPTSVLSADRRASSRSRRSGTGTRSRTSRA